MDFPGRDPKAWTEHAKEYAAMPFKGPMSIPATRILSNLNAAAPLSSASAILDVGCGPGMVISVLASEYGTQIPSSARIIASDFSSGMIDVCREKQAQKAGTEEDIGGTWTRLETAVYDVQNLKGVKDGEISHVTGSMVYFMVPNPRKGLEEAYRVLKEGGALSLSSFNKAEWMDLINEAAQRVRKSATNGFDMNKIPAWKTTEGLKGELEACGFKDVVAEYVTMDMPMQNPKMFVDNFLKSNNPGAKTLIGDFTPEDLDRAGEEFLKLVEGKDKLSGIIIVATGKK